MQNKDMISAYKASIGMYNVAELDSTTVEAFMQEHGYAVLNWYQGDLLSVTIHVSCKEGELYPYLIYLHIKKEYSLSAPTWGQYVCMETPYDVAQFLATLNIDTPAKMFR